MAVVEVRDLSKRFDGVAAVDGIDLASADGEFLVLLGPSGCGKTTLLRMIGGLEPPTERRHPHRRAGGDRSAAARPPDRDGLPELRALPAHDRLQQHRLPAQGGRAVQSRSRRGEWPGRRASSASTRYLDRKPRQLSGGQRQRVALARALVREPTVFLLDEPLSNLDAQRRASARDELQGFQRRVGTTTIYVTHDQVEAMGMGDRIAVMEQGRIRQVGTPHEIYDEPADTFVATFLGSPPMNLVPDAGLR